MKPLVSVIMPVYNGQAFLRQAIASVRNQSYQAWQLIVVDDGSTDATSGIVAGLDDQRILYVHQENRGQAAALNKGLELAQGMYVTTLDADDWLTPHSLSERVAFMEGHPEFGAVYGDGYFCDASGNALLRFSEYSPVRVTGDIYDALILTCFFGTGSPVMIRRRVLNEHAIRYDEEIVWCQDWDFYIRVAEKTPFAALDSVTVWYRLHDTNMTSVEPESRRREQIIRTELKVLQSPRFQAVNTASRRSFFYNLLVRDLAGRSDEQSSLVESSHFKALSARDQSIVLRLMAAEHLLHGKNHKVAVAWLQTAWSLSPWNPKTAILAGLATLNVGLAMLVTRVWRMQRSNQPALSPSDLSKRSSLTVA